MSLVHLEMDGNGGANEEADENGNEDDGGDDAQDDDNMHTDGVRVKTIDVYNQSVKRAQSQTGMARAREFRTYKTCSEYISGLGSELQCYSRVVEALEANLQRRGRVRVEVLFELGPDATRDHIIRAMETVLEGLALSMEKVVRVRTRKFLQWVHHTHSVCLQYSQLKPSHELFRYLQMAYVTWHTLFTPLSKPILPFNEDRTGFVLPVVKPETVIAQAEHREVSCYCDDDTWVLTTS